MMLVFLISILMIGGLLSWLVATWSELSARILALVATGTQLILSAVLFFSQNGLTEGTVNAGQWMFEFNTSWIPSFGIHFHLAMDGLSLLMVMLTGLLGTISVLVSWKQVKKEVGFYHFNLLWILAGITGVFLAMDLFLFYFFWEIMLIPMYFLIAIWGHEKRVYAAYKFFIFTQAGGLLMFLAIIGLYLVHGSQTGFYTFSYTELLNTNLDPAIAFWFMLAFLIAFAVKLPIIPFHSWLPDAHTEAPTAGSVILAGLLLKTGAYGILRFVIPMFPDASVSIAPYAMALGAISILYGGKLAFAQTDLKRLVAYTSVSHMGFIMLGAFAFSELAYQGVVMQMVTHGLSTGALFIIAGALQERLHTRNINEMGGFWSKTPKMGAVTLLFVMASLGLPGLGNFIAEILVLIGSFEASMLWTIIACAGLIISAIYALRIMQKVFYGPVKMKVQIPDLDLRESLIFGVLTILIIVLGWYPQPVIDTVQPVYEESRMDKKTGELQEEEIIDPFKNQDR